MDKITTVKPQIVFYGGGIEAAASFAVLSAMQEAGFEFSRIVTVGMSAIGALLFLAGTDEKTAIYMTETVCICPYDADKTIKRTLEKAPWGDCFLSEARVPFSAVM